MIQFVEQKLQHDQILDVLLEIIPFFIQLKSFSTFFLTGYKIITQNHKLLCDCV